MKRWMTATTLLHLGIPKLYRIRGLTWQADALDATIQELKDMISKELEEVGGKAPRLQLVGSLSPCKGREWCKETGNLRGKSAGTYQAGFWA